ncbi:MAG: FAD-binding oxidoreductase [Planctomycetota bacterium]|nr:MAG: FAD-binding oxidoreductase [Planctomycetota bacterium]
MEVAVVGCGVIGLTSALKLQELGYPVTLISKETPSLTTSHKAGAVWLPFEPTPPPKVIRWAWESYQNFTKLCHNPKTGVQPTSLHLLGSSPPPWLKQLPELSYRPLQKQELPTPYQKGICLPSFIISPPSYLSFLLDLFLQNGGRLLQQNISNLRSLPFSLVVNCTGLEAKKLVQDSQLHPIQGHIVQLKPLSSPTPCFFDKEGPLALAYIIPRQDAWVLGGNATAHQSSTQPNPTIIQEILEKCRKIYPPLQRLSPANTYVGLRPGRKNIRLEVEEIDSQRWVIHNYGHGGSGFTLSWGCAQKVAQLAQQLTPPPP